MDKMTTDTAVKIGAKITNIRIRQGMTQAETAQKAELSTNYYARIERGDANATVEALQSIARALNAKSSEILPF